MENTTLSDLSKYNQLAINAYRGTSFDPEKRGANIINEHTAELQKDLEQIPETEQERYAQKYKLLFSAWLNAKSRIVSTMIAGGSNFPVERMRKYNNWEHSAGERFFEFRRKTIEFYGRKEEREAKAAEIAAAGGEIGFYKQKLAALEKTHQDGLIVNRIYRKNSGLSIDELVLKINEAGINGDAYRKALQFSKAHGYAPASTENTRQHIDYYKGRVIQLERMASRPTTDTTDEKTGVRIVENSELSRIQLFFDGKPEESIRNILKSNGFRWAPSNGSWQNYLTDNGKWKAKRALEQIAALKTA